VTNGSAPQAETAPIALKDPVMAAFLTWLIPGLGQLYQGRTAKAVLFFVCITGIYVYGLYLGGNSELGYGRAVYFAFRNDEWRLPFICQIGVGLPTLPACVQAMRMNNDKPVWFDGFMAPPRPTNMPEGNVNIGQPTLDDLNRKLNRYFELATFFTMVAGLLNVLAIYDAFAGPVISHPKKEQKPGKPETACQE
jgi:TM2 domain-containing membrane protein YozV